MSGDRIDYIRVAYRGDPLGAFSWKIKYETLMDEFTSPRQQTQKTWSSFSKSYDAAQKTWVDTFECWGIAADYIFERLPASDRSLVTRIDYRVEMEKPQVGIATVDHLVQRNRGKSRRTITKIQSPARTKKGGRDAGGDFYAVGSRESERRSSYYQRSGEPWALEVQFGRGYPQKMHKEAVDLYLNTPGSSYHACYMKVAYAHFSEAIRDHFYLSPDQIAGREETLYQSNGVDFQESLLSDFDLLWQQLDPAAQEVVAEKVIAITKNRVIMKQEGLEEPADLWDVYPDVTNGQLP